MKRVLLRISCIVVLCIALLISCVANAKAHFEKPVGRNTAHLHKRFTNLTVTVTVPANLNINTDMFSNVATNVLLGTPVITGNTGTASVSNNAPSDYPIGVTAVLWTVIDSAGNAATATQTVTVTDTEKPFIDRIGEISVVNEPGKCGASVALFIPYAFDNSGVVTVTNDAASSFFQVGSVMITWTATDMFGNSDTSTQMITVIDNELPTISIGNVQATNDAGKCGAVVNLGTPITFDNCGIASVTNNAPAFFPVGTTIVTWTAADLHVYSATTTQIVTVTDNEKPTIIAPPNISAGNGSGLVLGTPVTSDNCGVLSVSNNAPSSFPTGTTIVTWTVIDNSGNLSTAEQTIVITAAAPVADTQAPVLSGVPAGITVGCDNIPVVAIPAAVDNVDAKPVITFNQVSTQNSNISLKAHYNYTVTRTWTAKDINGNSSSAKQVITVIDKTAPVLTVPANISVNNDINVCGAIVKFTVTASDNCNSPVTITYSKSSGTLFATGTTTVTIIAKDVSGNTTSRSFTVTVTDTQKPTITAPANKTITLGTGISVATNVSLGTPITADNCGVKSVTKNAPISYPVGTTIVTWTVKDNTGNVSTATQTVTVKATVSSKKLAVVAMGQSHSLVEKATISEKLEEELNVTVAPNPSAAYFSLKLESKSDIPVNLIVTDAMGRVVDARPKQAANSTIQIGHNYHSGTYFAEMVQGTHRKVIQLIKLK